MDAALRGLRERGYYPPFVLDIGAAMGAWTKHASRYWPRSHFYCIEALEERRRDLEALSPRTGADVTILICGVADADGVLKMGVTESLWDSSFAYEGKEARELRVFCLDTLLAEGLIKPPSFLKLDVQGFETRIISGGQAALKLCDVVLMECTLLLFLLIDADP
jgi:FkbM family methyltransferase